MSCDSFLETQLAEDAEGSGEAALEIVALLMLVFELWGSWESIHLALNSALLCSSAYVGRCVYLLGVTTSYVPRQKTEPRDPKTN